MGRKIDFMKEKYNLFKSHSYFINILVFFFKVVLFFVTSSLAFLISSLYNLGIGLARRSIYSDRDNYSSVGYFVVMASLCFIAYSVWSIVTHKVSNYNLYTGLAIATITFYDIGYSIYGVVKSIRKNNRQNKLLMLVNLATALISLELTQSAILSFTQVGIDNSLYNGIIGIIVGVSSLIIGITICLKKNA